MLDKIVETIIENRPRQIAVSFDDWRGTLQDELNRKAGMDDSGRFRDTDGKFTSRGSCDDNKVTYYSGDQYAYVMGVMVYWRADVQRGEMRVEK